MKKLIARTSSALAVLAGLAGFYPARAAITDNLVVHLGFDGNLQDSSGRGNHGTPVGNPGFVPGKVGAKAVAIVSKKDGSTLNYVTLGAVPDLNFGTATDFSICFWSRFKQWTFDPLLVSNKDWTSGAYPGYAIATGTDGRLQWNYSGLPGARKDYDGPAGTISDGNWHHVAVIFLRAGLVTTYLDGVEVDSRDVTFSLNNVDTPAGFATNIGQDGTGHYTDGGTAGVDDLAIDDLGIWRRALTASEARAIYTAGNKGLDLTTVISSPEAPTVRIPPTGQSVAAGTTVTLKVLPGGSSPFVYQWKRNGQPVANGTGAILVLADAQGKDAGAYTVEIKNSVGTIMSSPVDVAVDTTLAPEITEQPVPQNAPVGAAASFSVKARGVSPLTYQWLKDGVKLAAGTNSTLSLARIAVADAGKYSCTVTAGNKLASQSAAVALAVVGDITQGLVVHLTFDKDFTDSSSRRNNATPVGNPTLVDGVIGGKALRFSQKADGTSFNYLTLGNPADLDFADNIDFTISLWVKFSAWVRDPVLIANKDWNLQGSKVGWALATGADGRFQWNLKEQVGERADYDSGPALISDGKWHHVAVTFQRGGNATTFVDGAQVNSQRLPGSGTVVDPGYPINIGQDGTGTYTDNKTVSIDDGTIDDLAIWRRAVTPEEIVAIYRKGLLLGANVEERAVTDDLVAYLPFDNSLDDKSGRGNHGQPVGKPVFVPGKLGSNALGFSSLKDGTSFNYVTLGRPADLDFGKDTDFSVSFWSRFTTWTGDPGFIGNKDWGSGGNQGWIVATAGNGRLQWNIGDGNAGGRTRKDYDGPAGTLSDGQWHHVVVTFHRQGDAITYLDGVDVNHTPIAADLDSLDTPAGLATNIGQDGKGTYTDSNAVGIADGQIDDVAIWRRVLGPSEVAFIRSRGTNGSPLLNLNLVTEHSVTQGMVAYLPFENGYADESGRGNNGSPVGSPTLVPGKVGSNALGFSSQKDGRSFNYLTLGRPADLNFGKDTDFSVAFWTRFTSWSGDPGFIGNKDWGSGGNQGWIVATAGNGRLQWNIGDGDAGGRTRKDYDGPAGTLSDGRWHHVLVTFTRKGDAITYLDGVDVDHTPIAADLDSLDTPTGLATNIGQDGKGTYTDSNAVGIANGQIDEVAIWRRALTPQEAAVVHARGVAGVPLLATSIGMPRLSVARTPLGVVLSWPVATKAGFKLEGSPALGTNANWQPVPGVSGNSVTVQPSAQYYYRLKN